ncbi:MAG: SMC family ATPase [Candidatus Euphemobacter frigidus]|nr:SMC family ATPase [Candidatus Euphemobacter frigidus]MDP8275558.1 SMC family ATPase [Candidatus Euphemobacter frigidus]
MIVTRVQLNPFGGLNDTELTFQTGLNVLLGPNEAGKSTVFNAIFAALFVKTKLGKRDFENKIKKFLPLGEGDTIRVELDFIHNGKSFTLKKSWGGTTSAELTLPDGAGVTDEDAIEDRLAPLLGSTEGTYKSILMTYQTGLGRTLRNLHEEHSETVRNLGDILRAAILETDGVSIDRFRERLEAEYDDYFSHWDRKEDYPEKGMGIKKPWKRKVKKILRAFYDKEELRVVLGEVRRLEEELGKINQRIGEQTNTLEETEVYLKKNRQAVEDARERRTLSAELNGLQARLKNYKEANSRWPVLENKLEDLEKKLPGMEKREKTLASERTAADKLEKKRALREIYRRAQAKKKALEEAREALQKLKKISREDLKKLRAAIGRIDRLKAGLAAGKLTVRVTTKKNTRVTIEKDVEKPVENELIAGQSVEIRAGGRIKIDHPELSVEAISGDRPFEEISREYDDARKIHNDILAELAVTNINEAEAILLAWDEHAGIARQAERNLKDELGDYTFEELKQQVGETGLSEKARPLAEVVAEHEKVKGDIRAAQEEQARLKKQIEAYVKEYTDTQELLLALAEDMKSKKEIDDKIAQLAPLPEGVENAEDFIDKFRRREERVGNLRNQLSELKMEQIRLTENMPDETEEALEKRLRDAEDSFAAVKKEGEAIARIRDLTGPLLEEIDQDTFKGLRKDVEDMIKRLTGKRYRSVAMEESLPRGLVREDGQILTRELLSVGTRDDLALAIRLAMARQFLGKSEGFLIMDDPLVDLDPVRQKAAAEVLKTFAGKKQILILTCHSSHADRLKGNRVTLTIK